MLGASGDEAEGEQVGLVETGIVFRLAFLPPRVLGPGDEVRDRPFGAVAVVDDKAPPKRGGVGGYASERRGSRLEQPALAES